MRPRFRPVLAACALGVAASTFTPALTGSLPQAAARTRQSGSTHLTAPIVQPGTDTKSSAHAKLVGTVRFHPVRRHRVVQIQRQLPGGSWRNVVKKRENGSGTVTFAAAAYHGGTPYNYRGVALRWKGLPKVAAKSQSADVWQPAFTDDFNWVSFDVDPNGWVDRTAGGDGGTRDCSHVGDPSTRTISGGTLNLTTKTNPAIVGTCEQGDGSAYYLNPQVRTPNSYTRGTFAARVKFEKSRGQHGSFWLMPNYPQCSGVGSEIDAVEFFGKGYPHGGLASRVYDFTDCTNGTPRKIGTMDPDATDMLPKGDHWWSSYHVFSVEWTKHHYIFRVDGREHFRTTRGVSDTSQYLILSLLTSDWELRQAQNLGITPRGTMRVDWAAVYQK